MLQLKYDHNWPIGSRGYQSVIVVASVGSQSSFDFQISTFVALARQDPVK